MQAGGIGYGKASQAIKDTPKTDDKIVILGGEKTIELVWAVPQFPRRIQVNFPLELNSNAVQRSNPEMQKRAANAVRGMVESDENFIVSIHDHGAGGTFKTVCQNW